jgi:16S rRNA (cytidine1402-2'-O)-methyltransferase
MPDPTPFGTLYLLPCPLGEGVMNSIPDQVSQRISLLRVFVVERVKTARQFIRKAAPELVIDELEFFELNKHTEPEELRKLLQPLLEGRDVGLLSEAGCPGVADPGAALVRLAHESSVQVVPLVGPSSILLALMASGMNGQSFCFNGYLPAKKPELARELKRLEDTARRLNQTQLFIETPYRNNALMETALEVLGANTRLGVACDLTLPTEYIRVQALGRWKSGPLPDLHKRPTVFMIGA